MLCRSRFHHGCRSRPCFANAALFSFASILKLNENLLSWKTLPAIELKVRSLLAW
jgi:hypothetical protein